MTNISTAADLLKQGAGESQHVCVYRGALSYLGFSLKLRRFSDSLTALLAQSRITCAHPPNITTNTAIGTKTHHKNSHIYIVLGYK